MSEEREEAIYQWAAKLQRVAAKARYAGLSQTEILTALTLVVCDESAIASRIHLEKPGVTIDEACRLAREEADTARREVYRMFAGEEISDDEFDQLANSTIDATGEPVTAAEIADTYRVQALREQREYEQGYDGAPDIAYRYGLDEKRYRAALRHQANYDPRLSWHAHGARWVVQIGSPAHDAMIEVAERLAGQSW